MDPCEESAGAHPVPVIAPITLGQFLKVAGVVGTGGEAKQIIACGGVSVNGAVETRRGRRLACGDIIRTGSFRALVVSGEPPTTTRVDGPGSHPG